MDAGIRNTGGRVDRRNGGHDALGRLIGGAKRKRMRVMTRSGIALVREGFHRMEPRLGCVCMTFCRTLFELDLSLRPLFPSDLQPLAAHLAAGLETMVRSLDDLQPVLIRAPALGLRLASYGMVPDDLPTVGAALLATLKSELGDAFTEEARAAWRRAFWIVASATIGAMNEALPAAA
jgi:hemoglobin-like flavoprotein